jgi:hypothetical protein
LAATSSAPASRYRREKHRSPLSPPGSIFLLGPCCTSRRYICP